jgi:predicted kinase
MLIGAQGSGKTRWAERNREQLNAVVVASDDVRNDMITQGWGDPRDGDQVFAEVERRLRTALATGQNIILDATHSQRRFRTYALGPTREHGYHAVAVWFDLPLEVVQARNAARSSGDWGARPEDPAFVASIYAALEPPGADEFDEIRRMTKNALPSFVIRRSSSDGGNP